MATVLLVLKKAPLGDPLFTANTHRERIEAIEAPEGGPLTCKGEKDLSLIEVGFAIFCCSSFYIISISPHLQPSFYFGVFM